MLLKKPINLWKVIVIDLFLLKNFNKAILGFIFLLFQDHKEGKIKIKTESNKAITPPNFLGIDRKIA